MDSPDLIERLVSGDLSCFEDILALYAEDVLRLCVLLVRDEEEAKDILQETCLRFIHAAKKGRFKQSNGSIKGYLSVIARNLCIDRLRKKIDLYSFDEECLLRNTLNHPQTPDQISSEGEIQSMFQNALNQLNDAERTVLVLHDVNNESYTEIAKALNLNINNVRTRLWRAREKLRRILEPYIKER